MEKIAEIREKISTSNIAELPGLIALYGEDERQGAACGAGGCRGGYSAERLQPFISK